MNLNEERNYMKMQEAVEALTLTERNRTLAEEYMDLSREENTELLKKAERQDYSEIEPDNRKKTVAYVEHCEKRKKEEELKRFVRLVSAVGGSTAFYPLAYYFWSLSFLEKYVSREQWAAMNAESKVWSIHTIGYKSLQPLFNMAEKEPEVLYHASERCYHRYNNAKVLLTAIYVSAQKPAGGLLKTIFGKDEKPEVKTAVQFLETDLIDSIPAMFSAPAMSEEERKTLRLFLEKDTQKGTVPAEVSAILKVHNVSAYLLTLLAGSAFLGMEHSGKLRSFLRLCLAANSSLTLNACIGMAKASWYTKQEEALEEILPISGTEYVQWCVSAKRSPAVKRMVKSNAESVHQAIAGSSTEEYAFLMECVKEASPGLYKKWMTSYEDNFMEKTAADLVSGMTAGKDEAKAYLLGRGELESLYPFTDAWRNGNSYNYYRFQSLERMKNSMPQLYERALVVEALKLQGYAFTVAILKQKGNDWENAEELINILEKEKLPLSYQLEAYDAVYASVYMERKAALLDRLVEALAKKWDVYAQELRLYSGKSTAVGRYICIRILDIFWQQEKETLFACAADTSKMVKELLTAVYAGHKEWEEDVLALLSSGKSQEREMAVLVLKKWGVTSYMDELTDALEKEKSKKMQELLKECLGMAGQEADAAGENTKTPKELAADILKGGKKRKIAWIFETPMTEVPLKDGSEAPEEYLQALLVSYADMPVPGFCQDAKTLAEQLAEEKLADFMTELFDKWLEMKAEAKKKWVLYAASVHGGRKIIPLLHHQIQEWPQHARGAMAAEAVKALALNGSSEALLLVDNISRKFKFRQVKTAAGEALSYAAEQMGISRAELEDKIIPDLGFGEDMSRNFDYGTRSFTVYLNPDLELEVLDMDKKKLKTLPAPGKKDDEEKAAQCYAEFKQLKKQLKTVVSNQKLRLEQALIAERLWNTEQWEALFVKNPVMHQFAIGLIWGIYESGNLTATFRYMEDGSFNTVDEEEYELPSDGKIGLVHPIELEKEMREAWKEQLSDYEVTQPIEQLEREVFYAGENEKGETELTRFGGKLLNGLSLSGKLQTLGWYRGSVQDAGVYSSFYREDGAIAVELEFSGCYVGDENEDVTVYGAAFYKAGTVKRGSYIYDTIKPENRYQLGKVPPRYFSEMVRQLTKATASSQEQLAYPECRN